VEVRSLLLPESRKTLNSMQKLLALKSFVWRGPGTDHLGPGNVAPFRNSSDWPGVVRAP
jgi:hypothetical protein